MKQTMQSIHTQARPVTDASRHRTSPWRYRLFGALMTLPLAGQAQLSLPAEPLFIGSAMDPNIMLLLDSSGSMQHVVPSAPYNESATYDGLACPGGMQLSASSSIDIKVHSSGYPYFTYGGTNYDFGVTSTGTGNTSKTMKCFNPTALYTADLATNLDGAGNAQYTGHYLNWYFGSQKDASDTYYGFGVGAKNKAGQQRRIEITKTAATALVDSMANVNLGLSKYNGGSGAQILNLCSDIDAGTQRADVKAQVNAITASGTTPLAASLHQIGRYFVGHSGASTSSTTEVFGAISAKQYDGILTIKTTDYDEDAVFDTNPAYRTGLSPTGESPIAYSCQNNFAVLLTDGLPNGGELGGTNPLNGYNNADSYDLDDIAKALYEADLRPDVYGKTNLRTYTIGLADPVLLKDPLLENTATAGGGVAYTAKDAAGLKKAFDNVLASIMQQKGSNSSASFSSAMIESGTQIFFSQFNTADWSGNLFSYTLSTAALAWTKDAATQLNEKTASSRVILTHNADGVSFHWDNLSTSQKNDLRTKPDGSAGDDASGQARLNFIRGDRANEGTTYRKRTSVLGDIIHSTPIYVGKPEIDWPIAGYADFKKANAAREGIIYVGANDGMLHAFESASGEEVFAYIPGNLYSTDAKAGLHYLTDPAYAHRFYVDLTPSVSDAQLGSDWKTVLIGGQRSGGRGLFALDITDPSTFSETNAANMVLWEFSDTNDSDLGYTYSQPIVGKTNYEGKWAVFVGNGYNSTAHKAALFIIFLDGSGYVKIEAPAAGVSASAPNGLSSPAVIDNNGDAIADAVYAGDLHGNLWAFDVSDKEKSNWKVRHGSNPLFKSSADTPITSAPQVVELNCKKTGMCEKHNLVIFGTGRYLTDADKSSTTTQRMLGVIDRNSDTTGGITLDKLVQQTVTEVTVDSNAVRYLSANAVNWSAAATKGWYFNLPESGERIIVDPFIRGDIAYFNTMRPTVGICTNESTNWFMGVDWATGGRPVDAVFDRTKNKVVDIGDAITVDSTQIHISGMKTGGNNTACIGDKCYTPPIDSEDGAKKPTDITLDRLGVTQIQPLGGLAKKRMSWQELVQ